MDKHDIERAMCALPGLAGGEPLRVAVAAVLDTEKHNGWTNRETWTVHLWLTNEQQAYASCREIAEECSSDQAAGEQIRERWCTALAESAGPSDGLLCDLITCAMGRVDWRAIGRAFREA